MNRVFLLAGTAAGVMVMAACGNSTGSTSSSAAAQPTSAPASSSSSTAPASVGVGSSNKLGQFVVDGRGFSLYLFEADTTSKSTCSGQCAANWPPLLTSGAPMAGTGVMQSLLGTTQRDDGTTQVTYNGHPLYFFVSDTKPGDTAGEGLMAFGAGWDAVSPAGQKIEGGS